MRMMKIGGRGTGDIRCHVTGRREIRRLYVIYTSLMHVIAQVIERGDMRGVSDVRGSGMSSAILV